MVYSRPIVMSIAGLDPTGGAGILADIKTFEQHKCLGFGIASALTIQTASRFIKVKWLTFAAIKAQAEPLLNSNPVGVVKIGIVKDFQLLLKLVEWLKKKNKNLKILWDPVISSSSGFSLIRDLNQDALNNILCKLELLTPNINEALLLADSQNEDRAAISLGQQCNILLKGGHSVTNKGTDILYTKDEKIFITSPLKDLPPKHGSGCILSAAISANIALGLSLSEACIQAKQYIERTLSSNPNLLAYHV